MALALAVAGAAVAYRWWTADERAIRARLDGIAEALTSTAEEPELASLARLARLRTALAPDVRVLASPPRGSDAGAGPSGPREIAGRDTVMALATRWSAPPGGVTVEFVDVQVTLDESRELAEVYCTGTITSRDLSGQPIVDARELRVELKKTDGAWLVTSVHPEETIRR